LYDTLETGKVKGLLAMLSKVGVRGCALVLKLKLDSECVML